MKNKTRKQYLLAVLAFLLFYAVLLILLVLSEKDQPGAHIHTIGDAIWYSLVTISTVGYGDVTPVSHAGHIIGIIFLLMSMGLLVALFGSVVSVLTSEGFPMLRVKAFRCSDWDSEDAATGTISLSLLQRLMYLPGISSARIPTESLFSV